MNVIYATNYQEMSKKAADIIIRRIKENPKATIGFATGSTPIGLYKELIHAYERNEVSFKEITTFNLDEYVGLEPTHVQSYDYFMKNMLFEHLDVSPENIHLPKGTGEAQLEAWAYEEKINEVGGIDVQLLGIGENGHIGFNEPGTSFASITHIAELTEETRKANARFFETENDVPTHAITMGIENILQAKEIILLISGENKKQAFDQLMNGQITEQFPASALKIHPNITVIVTADVSN